MVEICLNISMHKEQERLFVQFEYNKALNQILRKLPGATWSQSRKQWHFMINKQVVEMIRKETKEIAVINIRELKAQLQIRKESKETARFQLSDENNTAVKDFVKWMVQKRYSEQTIVNYTNHLSQFLKHYQPRSFEDLAAADVTEYNYQKIIQKNHSISYQRSLVGAVKLFYSAMPKSNMELTKLQRPFKENKLPQVLSKEEVQSLLQGITNLKHKAILSLTYACGLRRSEVLNLQMTDLDKDRKLIRIVQAKGRKDRYVSFSKKLRELLVLYYMEYKPAKYLFEGQYGGKYSARSFAQVLERSLKATRITKDVSLHTLRHSFATHLLESGTDIRYIQKILGHSSPKTTMIYTHVSTNKLSEIASPFDDLDL